MTNYILNGILGLAVGDALGYAAQGKTREILKFAPVLEMKRGLWSDDTSLTLCTLASLRENDWRLNYVDLMERFSKWLEYGYMTPEGTVLTWGLRRSELYKTIQVVRRWSNVRHGTSGTVATVR